MRLNRINPTGSASRKNARSSRLSDGPAQPKMTALGSGLGKNAFNAALPQLRAEALCLARIGDRTDVQAIEHASLAEIGELLRHRSPQTTALYARVDLGALRALAVPWPGDA